MLPAIAQVAARVSVRVDAERPVAAVWVVHVADDASPARGLDRRREMPDPNPGGDRARTADGNVVYPGVRAWVDVVPTGCRRLQPGQPLGLRAIRLVVGFWSQQRGTAQSRDGDLISRRRSEMHPEHLAGFDADRVDVAHQAGDSDGPVRWFAATRRRRRPQLPGLGWNRLALCTYRHRLAVQTVSWRPSLQGYGPGNGKCGGFGPGRPGTRSLPGALVALLLCTCRRWDRVTARLIAAARRARSYCWSGDQAQLTGLGDGLVPRRVALAQCKRT